MDNRQIVREQIPQGKLTPQHFRLQTTPAPTPGDGEVLVRTRYISLDAGTAPGCRARPTDRPCRPAT